MFGFSAGTMFMGGGGSSGGSGGGRGPGTNPGRPGGESGMRGSSSSGGIGAPGSDVGRGGDGRAGRSSSSGGSGRSMDGSFGSSTGGMVSGGGSTDTIAGSSRARSNFATSTRSQINANSPQSFRDSRAITEANGFFSDDMGLTVDLSGGVMAPNDPGDRANYSEPGFRNSVERSIDGSNSFTAYADSLMNPGKYAKSPQGILGTVSSFAKSAVDNAPSIIGGLVAGPPGALAGTALDAAVDAKSIQDKLNSFRGGPEVSYGDALGQIGGERAASALGRAVVGPIAGEVAGNVVSGFTSDPVNQMAGSFVGNQVGGALAGSMLSDEVGRGGPLGSETLAQNARDASSGSSTPAIASPASPSPSSPQGVDLASLDNTSSAVASPATPGMTTPQGVALGDPNNPSSATASPALPSIPSPEGVALANPSTTGVSPTASPGSPSATPSTSGLFGLSSQGAEQVVSGGTSGSFPSAQPAPAPPRLTLATRPAPSSTGIGEFSDYSSYARRVFSRF